LSGKMLRMAEMVNEMVVFDETEAEKTVRGRVNDGRDGRSKKTLEGHLTVRTEIHTFYHH